MPFAATRSIPDQPARRLWRWPWWVLVGAAVIVAAVWIVRESAMTPSFDAYGWLTWGHQVLYGDLNLNGGPSWKPLMMIFALPMAPFHHLAPRLLSVAMVAGTVAMAPLAGRIAYRLATEHLTPAQRRRRVIVAAWIGALVAAAGVLGMQGRNVPIDVGPGQSLWHLSFIADSDPLTAALALAAIDAHLSRRFRLAYVVLFLVGLSRPEAWAFVGLYGVWLAWRVPGTRTLVLGGWVITLIAWYLPTGLAANNIFEAGALNHGKVTAIKGDPIIGVLRRWVTFYEWPMQAAALLGVAIGLARRDLRVVGIAACAALWLAVEVAFSLHGFSATPRYVIEPAAAMIPLAGYAIARMLAGAPAALPGRLRRWTLDLAGLTVAAGLLVGLGFFWHVREYRVRKEIGPVRNYGVVVRHLSAAVQRAGGPRAILACGPPAALNTYQTQLAWAMNLNASQVLFNPSLLLGVHRRMVLFTETGANAWMVRAYNVPGPLAARCARTVSVTIPSS